MDGLSKVVECLAGLKRDPNNPHHLSALADALQQLFQEGLVGNRTVSRGDVWGLVTAATRAFPIQLSPSVEKAQEVLAAGAANGSTLLHTWIIQATADGSLPVLVQKLRSQPQILTAYARDAPLRQPATADKLVAVLQQLQDLIPVSPYDQHLQAKAAAPAASDQPTVHIQTELDLVLQQQQQQPSPLVSPASSVAGGHSSNSSSAGSNSSSSGQGKAASAGSSAAGGSQHGLQPKQQQGLVGRLRSARLPQLGSFTNKASQQQQQQHCDAQLLQVQLKVLPPEQLSSATDTIVQLRIQVLQQQDQQQKRSLSQQQQQQPSPRGAAAAGAGSSSSGTGDTAVPPSGSSVKGLLQGLHQSAASGLQQAAATAAGQDLQGAVAAAGGAVAAAFGSVKGLQRFKAGSKQQQEKTATAAGGAGAESSSKGKAASKQASKAPTAATAADAGAAELVLAVRLLLRSAEDAAAQGPIQLQLTALPAAAEVGRDAGWSSRGMLGRLRLARGSGSTNTSTGSSRAHYLQQEVPAEALSIEQQQQQQGDVADPLEGDMWSVMSRLKASSTTNGLTAVQSAADTAAEAMVQQLQESGAVLQKQLVSCCKAVCTAASSTKGSLGEESPDLLQLIEHIKGLLNHGLSTTSSHGSGSGQARGTNSSSKGNTPEPGGSSSSSVAAAVKAAATARDMLGGLLLHGRQQSAFGVLQALQHGSKQQPRLMLGADGIANMKAAKSATPATKLDLWVRASLNEQLLGVRVSTLLVNPHALKPWYHPQALLLQHGPMAGVMQELQELSQFRFALPVDAAAGVLVGPSVATVGQKAGNTIQQQQQQQQGQVAGSAIGSGDASGKKALSAAGAAASGSNSSRSSSMAAALDPRKYFGSFSAGLGSLRSSSTTAQASAAVTAAAGSSGSNAASSSNPAIPTFLWGAAPGTPGSSGTTTPAATAPAAAAAPAAAGSIGAAGATAATAAATAVTAATAATGGFFRRRRVPAIKEVRVPAPGSGAVLSREPSSTLSPMSTEDETAYAEWWSPNNGSQDLSAAVAAVMDGGSGSNGAAQGRRPGSSNSLRSYGSTGGQPGSSSGTPRSPAAAMAAVAVAGAGGGVPRSASRQSRADSEVSTGATSEAALQLEQDLQAAMSAPLLVEQFSSSRRSSSGHGGSSSGSSGGGGVVICRSGSAGWDAAVAAARARSMGHGGVGCGSGRVGSSVGLSAGGLSAGVFAALSRRSRSPEADVRRMGEGAGSGVGGGAGRRPRHMHKRSSSLNDLPELEALWMDGGGA